MDAIIAHAKSDLPNEACGLMFGNMGKVEQIRPILNRNPSPVSYSLDSQEQLSVTTDMASRGLKLVGIYHSHPDSPPIPSLTDIKRAYFPGTKEPNFPEAVYMIVGLSGDEPEVNAFFILGSEIQKVEIVVVR